MNLSKKIALFVERQEDASVPSHIRNGLKPSISLRPYQEEAIRHFLCYETDSLLRTYPAHLLFHMATGSGKTVIMAALIIHLYKKGYRNFLFFVNSSNIVEKTKENFLAPASSKYLFADPVVLDGKKVNIRNVSNFDDATEDDINIHFTTIQGLHSNLNNSRENAVTYEDFEDKKIVLISDEAHHINALTKRTGKLKSGKQNEVKSEHENSWEETVQEIFDKNRDNFLLEFTATIEMGNDNIKKKYEDKIIYDYPLKKFRMEGYSKEVILRQSRVDPLERMFQTVLFSQYRRKVAEGDGLHIKPVVLMKSKTVGESKKNTRDFIDFIGSLTGESIRQAKERYSGDQSLSKIFDYFFDERKLDYDNFAMELKEDFSSDKIINVNDANDLKNYQIRVNSLEDTDNEIRVVFVVNKLNEGWDVLNLFDIARLYETRDSRKNQVGNTTIQEAQLIGRGARYCPFIDAGRPEEPREKRKYDQDTDHPLRRLEELHYHCSHNPKYISEIKGALQKAGMMDDPENKWMRVKDSFKKSNFYKYGYIYVNEKIKNRNENKHLLGKNLNHKYNYPTVLAESAIEESDLSNRRTLSGATDTTPKDIRLDDIAILRRAADGIEFFSFDNIKTYFPFLNSMDDLFQDIAKFVLASVRGDKDKINNLNRCEQKDIYYYTLTMIEEHIRKNSLEFMGTTEFKRRRVRDVVIDKHIYINDENQLLALKDNNTFEPEWYVYEQNLINSYEECLVQYVRDRADKIKEKYDDFYLIRNEKLVKLYSFNDGRGIEPDFLLFAIKGDSKRESVICQLFIEPKGEHIEQSDKWKQKFLEEIKKNVKVMNLYENAEYKIVGLPFYNKRNERKFRKAFEEGLFEDDTSPVELG